MIKTFAFIDLETTGLPIQESNLTRITELCIVACSADTLKSQTLPRVLHKLTLCFNPQRDITKFSMEMTKLDNELLCNANPFDDNTSQLLDAFLNHLPTPVCFVAHNGTNFDYPILQTHLTNLGKCMPNDVYCCDSFTIFKQTLRNQNSFKLGSIYRRLVGSELTNAHGAEADAIGLMRCAINDPKFVEYAEKSMYLSTKVKPLNPYGPTTI